MVTGDPLSIVIPSRGEGATLIGCVAALDRLDGVWEAAIAAHGETAAIRRQFERHPRITWIETRRASRALQLNAGAAATGGRNLLFLHADTRLPVDAVARVAQALATPGAVGGAFTLAFDTPHPALGLLERLSALPWRATYLGDQAFFCRRAAFMAVGGFGDQPLMEDVRLAAALARRGRLVRVRAPVVTSARRFVAGGAWRQLALNAALLGLHHLGVPARHLARAYRP